MTTKVTTINNFRKAQLSLPAILLIGLALLKPAHASAQDPPPASAEVQTEISYEFGQTLTFGITATNEPEFSRITLLWQPAGDPQTYSESWRFEDPSSNAGIDLNYNVDISQGGIQAFTVVFARWILETPDGQFFETEPTSIFYADDRFDWRSTSDQQITVYWHTADPETGQIVLDTALESLDRLAEIIPVDDGTPINIYVYQSTQELSAVANNEWVGGFAAPEIGVVTAVVENPRTAPAVLKRRLPHEMAHLLLFRALGGQPAYDRLPLWFEEGLATYVEDPINPNLITSLDSAIENDQLMAFDQLCERFPTSPEESVFLAYAQSYALVNFMQEVYGNQALTNFILATKDGADCDNIAQRALNVSQADLETAWLVSEGVDPPGTIDFQSTVMALVLLVIIGTGLLIFFFSLTNVRAVDP